MEVPVVPGRLGASTPEHTRSNKKVDQEKARSHRPSAALRLSDRGKRADAQKAILEKALAGINERFSRDGAFAEAGRSDYLKSIANPTDLSSEATAGRILGGITGYIYGAFKLAQDQMGSEEFAKFKSQVLEGFDRGMGEARHVLGALEVLDPELATEIKETERLVREGLDKFFSEEAERIRGAEAA